MSFRWVTGNGTTGKTMIRNAATAMEPASPFVCCGQPTVAPHSAGGRVDVQQPVGELAVFLVGRLQQRQLDGLAQQMQPNTFWTA